VISRKLTYSSGTNELFNAGERSLGMFEREFSDVFSEQWRIRVHGGRYICT
jgi:hypothetical protein